MRFWSRRKYFAAWVVLSCCVLANFAFAGVTVVVDADREIGPVNKGVFGNNLIAYDPLTYEHWTTSPYYGYMDYGAGMWDPSRRAPVEEAVRLCREAGITSLRFPGGCGAHHYDWKKAIGGEREHFLFGLDEFLTVCAAAGAEPVLTVSYFTGDEQDAADLVAYLNLECGPGISARSCAWAQERAKNGHAAPYGVRYFEIGNEVWHGDHREIASVSPEAYAERYLEYYEAMKRFDPRILIGAVLLDRAWNEKVLGTIGDKIDFGILHFYPAPPGSPKVLKAMDPRAIFRVTLDEAVPSLEEEIAGAVRLLEEKAGRPVPLAITEFNGGFLQDEPVPYRHALGTALVNAEMIRVFLKPEHRVLMANYWQFSDSYWGMIRSRNNYMDPQAPISFAKRPNYYVYEFYKEHFGDDLIGVDVAAAPEEGEGAATGEGSADLSVSAVASRRQGRIYVTLINKDMDAACPVRLEIKDFRGDGKAALWVLSGPRVEATDEEDPGEVRVGSSSLVVRAGRLDLQLPPHSLAAVEIDVPALTEKANVPAVRGRQEREDDVPSQEKK